MLAAGVDACVLLNLLASGRPLTEFSASLGAIFSVADQAAREVIWLDPVDAGRERELIDVDTMLKAADIGIVSLKGSALVRFIELASRLGDGEAATLALVESHGWALLTDDRKAQRVAGTLEPAPQIITTAAVLRAWSHGRSPHEISACIQMIEARASFHPPRHDPDRAWWFEAIARPEQKEGAADI